MYLYLKNKAVWKLNLIKIKLEDMNSQISDCTSLASNPIKLLVAWRIVDEMLKKQ